MIKVFEWLYTRSTNFYWKVIYKIIRAKYEIDNSFIFNGKEIEFYGEGEIQCGPNSYIGSYSTVHAHENCKVIIGKGCRISHNVRIYTSTLIADQDFSLDHLEEKIGDVVIGDFVWIGANVFINPGIKVGNNSIVGANSVLTKDVADFEIVGGVPAKVIRTKVLSQNK